MLDIRNYAVIGLGVAVAVLLATVGAGRAQLASERAAHSQTKANHAEVLRDLAERTAKAAGATLAAQQALSRAVAAIDTKHTKELSRALAQNDDLRAAVRRGDVRLRIAASCPAKPAAAGPDVSAATVAPGVADATAPELDAAARQDYFDLRADIEQVRAMILGLQDYARVASDP